MLPNVSGIGDGPVLELLQFLVVHVGRLMHRQIILNRLGVDVNDWCADAEL